MFKNSKIYVLGGSGMIGRELIKLLLKYQPKYITNISYDGTKNQFGPPIDGIRSFNIDLRDFETCKTQMSGADFIFHLAGIKGSPLMTATKPASFMVPMLMFNTAILEAIRQIHPKWALYTSSIGVYEPAEILKEDDVWQTMPSKNDWYSGWTKRIGELQIEAYKKEYNTSNISIVRPANTYGQYDNFNPDTAMVIPTLISRVCNGENPLKVWGNGEQIRDIIHAEDVARGMIHAVEKGITEPMNLGSGKGVLIRELVEIVVAAYKKLTDKHISVLYDPSKPTGDPIRLMNMTRANSYGFYPKKTLEAGIFETVRWYLQNKDKQNLRYEPFK